MRNSIVCYINHERHEISEDQAFLTLSDYLRYEAGLIGTKVVCAEGDCAACTIVYSRFQTGEFQPYQSMNSCISFMYLLDQCHIITVEGLKKEERLHEAQQKMMDHHGAQCGYCTPGFICSLAFMAEDLKRQSKEQSPQKVKNYLTGNLCRCTGYEPIIKAAMDMNLNRVEPFSEVFDQTKMKADFKTLAGKPVQLEDRGRTVHLPVDYASAAQLKASQVKMTSGATDLGVQYNKGKYIQDQILSLNNIPEAYEIRESDQSLLIGAKVSLSQVEKVCEKHFPEFSGILRIFAAPGIKNVGTLVGNLVNASPIADSIPFLMVNQATIHLQSPRGTRTCGIQSFFKGGYKELDLEHDEIVTAVEIHKSDDQYKLYKVSLRKDLDISAVTFAARFKQQGAQFTDLQLAFGGVGPIVLQTNKTAQSMLVNNLTQAKKELEQEITPISDIRGSKEFRYQVAKNLLQKFHDQTLGAI